MTKRCFGLSVRYPLFPDDQPDRFGSPNYLGSEGGLLEQLDDNGSQNDDNPVQTASDDAEVTESPRPSGDDAPSAHKDMPASKGGHTLLKAVALLALIAAAAGAVASLVYYRTHAIFGELFDDPMIFSSGEKLVNLSGSDFNDYSQISKLKSVEEIDLTNTPVNDLSVLYDRKSLRKVILADRVLKAEECVEFYSHLPDALLICKVDVGGEIYPSDVSQLTVENADADVQPLFAALKNLIRLDLTACDVSDDTFRSLSKSLPECLIVINVELCGRQYRTDDTAVVLNGEITQADADRVGFFRNLKTLDARNCTSTELVDKIIADHPDVKLNEPIDFLGVTVGIFDETVDLRGHKYSLESVRTALAEIVPKMPFLRKIDMCGCGLSNSEMEQLCGEYPDIKFVWILHFGHWKLRTDAVAFSALNSNDQEFYTQAHYAPIFKYCTDLRALDLGHSLITDISAISSLKKLRAVILTDNKITDISAFAELKDLEFIEMNVSNRVKSVEPLRNLENLRFVNLWGSMEITDLSPLYNHDKLEIAILERTIPKEERDRFKESNPNCATFFKVDSSKVTTNSTWRENPYRVRLKQAFRTERAFYNWKYITGFDEETGEYIVDYNSDQYKYD